MSAYRFCRTDDIPLLVAAYNECGGPCAFRDPPLTLEGFKRDAREIGLWASSCMIALERERVVGVLLGAKRDGVANFVHRLCVRPGHQRRGHGRHLLESLVRKVAILGPPRLLAEPSSESSPARGILESVGFRTESRFADFVLEAALPRPRHEELVESVSFEELRESGVFDPAAVRSWTRSLPNLEARAPALEGLAVASDMRIEAFVLSRPAPGREEEEREILALGCAADLPQPALLHLLLCSVYHRDGRALRIPRVSVEEVPFDWLAAWGFRRQGEIIGYATATAAACAGLRA